MEVTSATTQNVRPSLARLLEDEGLASRKEIEEAFNEGERTGERFGEVLLRWQFIDERNLAKLLARQWDVPFLDEHELAPESAALEIFSPEEARRLGAVPVRWEDDSLRVAVAEPTEERLAKVRAAIPGDILFSVVTPRSFVGLLTRGHAAQAPPAAATAQPAAEHADSRAFDGLLASLDDETAHLRELSDQVQRFAELFAERDLAAKRLESELASAQAATDHQTRTMARMQAELEERDRAYEQELGTSEHLRIELEQLRQDLEQRRHEIEQTNFALEQELRRSSGLKAELEDRHRVLALVAQKLGEAGDMIGAERSG